MQRIGKCKRCGQCCKRRVVADGEIVEVACDFLYYENGIAYCMIYDERPEECRRYPESPDQSRPGCGFRFSSENR